MRDASLVLFICGLLFFWLGIDIRRRWLRFVASAYQTAGLVVDKKQVWVFAGSTPVRSVRLIVRFVTNLGQTREFQLTNVRLRSLEINDEVSVLYDPANPAHATLATSPGSTKALGEALIGAGVLFLTASLVLLFLSSWYG
jgi:hypothetical protein